jgi:Fe-S cluster biogenesis protein NfuA
MTDTPIEYTRDERIAALLEQISAYIEQFHRGSVDLVKIEGNVVTVRLGGACEKCPLLPATLQGWVAGTVRQFFPEIQVISEDIVEEG